METPLEMYKRQIAAFPVCERSWFAVALARHRMGEKTAAGEISSRCLHLALQMAERRAAQTPDRAVLDFVEQANVALWSAIKTYSGSDLGGFLRFAEQKIDQRLNFMG